MSVAGAAGGSAGAAAGVGGGAGAGGAGAGTVGVEAGGGCAKAGAELSRNEPHSSAASGALSHRFGVVPRQDRVMVLVLAPGFVAVI
jgi:hypothetical protein